MLINFDADKSQFILTKRDDERDRTFYALSEPRVLLRLDGFDLEDIQAGEWCDASIGWDRGDSGFVCAENVGKRHTKITLRAHGLKEFSINPPPDLKMLSAVIAAAPRRAARFDETKIADEAIALLTEHVTRLSHRLSIGGWLPGVPEDQDFCPLREEIHALCRIANGEVSRTDVDADFLEETQQLIQDIAELTAWWWSAEYVIPPQWRETDLGRAWDAARFWLLSADMLTLSDAARMLYDAADANDLNKIDRLIRRGDLTEYADPNEANPQRARRVLKSEVKALLKRRAR